MALVALKPAAAKGAGATDRELCEDALDVQARSPVTVCLYVIRCAQAEDLGDGQSSLLPKFFGCSQIGIWRTGSQSSGLGVLSKCGRRTCRYRIVVVKLA